MYTADTSLPMELNDVFLRCIVSNPTIHDLIFAHSTPATVIRFSWTCKAALLASRSYYRRAYNVDRHLSRYFRDPQAFRTLQARTATLISGSSALQFFDRTCYPESDLDIYTPLQSMREVANWLLSDGYRFVPDDTQPGNLPDALRQLQGYDAGLDTRSLGFYRMRGVLGVYTFHKITEDDWDAEDRAQPLKVQVTVAARSPAEVIINFHSTCVMNAISHEAAYSLYPHATFESRFALVCPTEGPAPDSALEKYAERGWHLVCERPEAEEPLFPFASGADAEAPSIVAREPSFLPGSRWADDHTSWVIPLHPALPPHVRAEAKAAPFASTNWQLAYHLDDDESPSPKMRYCLVRSPLLKHVYLLTDELLLLAVWSALKGVRSGRTVMQRVLDRAKHRQPIDAPRHDHVLYTECQTYREAVKARSLPQTLWRKGPPGDPIFSL